MKKKLFADTEDLKLKMKEMVSKCEEIIDMLNKTRDKIDESKSYFDTPTASVFRDKALFYIDEQRLLINKDLIPSFEILDKISAGYEEDFNNEKSLLGGKKKNDKGGKHE